MLPLPAPPRSRAISVDQRPQSSNRQTFEEALARLHAGDAPGAVAMLSQALCDAPADIDLLTLLGAAHNACGEHTAAIEVLSRALARAPRFARAREERALALLKLRRPEEAVSELQECLAIAPGNASARRRLAQTLIGLGRGEDADAVLAGGFAQRPGGELLLQAAEHQRAGRLRESEPLLRRVLEREPDEIDALRMLARVAEEAERLGEAERLLRRVIALAPTHDEAELALARVLKQREKMPEALAHCAATVSRSPRNALARYLHASFLAHAGHHEEALAEYEACLAIRPDNAAAWVGLGHLRKTLGHQAEGIAAYREALKLHPDYGEVWWSLANLKTFRFSAEDVAEMERRLSAPGLDEDARVQFLFALAKAREDAGEHARAFETYAEANARQRMRVSHDPVASELMNERIRASFTPALFARHAVTPHSGEPVPIFIVGLPRSGSTLLEQILASHPLVEGTAELPDIGRICSEISRRYPGPRYPDAIAQMDAVEFRELGNMYLERTRRMRSGKPFFTDKMPNNFASVGLIRLILPQACIVDARRHPLDSCLGCFKQHFALGQSFTYDLDDLADFYLGYRSLMQHWHEVLPGQVLDFRLEELIRDQEAQTRRLLDHCGLPWDDACLDFHRTARAVRTASSEQVRQPLYDSSVDYWRRFREQLSPLLDALGPSILADGWTL